jgi:hypothetical protein
MFALTKIQLRLLHFSGIRTLKLAAVAAAEEMENGKLRMENLSKWRIENGEWRMENDQVKRQKSKVKKTDEK